MADRFNPDSFGTFLESMQRGKARTQPQGTVTSRILNILLSTPAKRLSTSELLRQLGVGVTEFANALSALQSPGYVSIAIVSGEEIAELTKSGEEIGRLGVLA